MNEAVKARVSEAVLFACAGGDERVVEGLRRLMEGEKLEPAAEGAGIGIRRLRSARDLLDSTRKRMEEKAGFTTEEQRAQRRKVGG